jgi:hypothetical protein
MIILKIFNGTMIDAQFNLDLGIDLSVSNSYNSDIYIDNNNENLELFNINITNDNIVFKDCINLFDNGDNQIIDDYPYELPLFFKFGDIKIGIGKIDELVSWELAKQDEVHNLMIDENIEPIHDNNVSRDLEENLQPKLFNKIKDKFQEKSTILIKLIKEKVIYLYKIYPKYFHIGGAVLFIIFILSIYLYNSHINSNKELYSEKKYEKNIIGLKKNFADLPSKYMDLSLQNSSKGYLICGLVEQQKDISYLKNRFDDYTDIVTYNLSTVDVAIDKINLVLKDANIYNIKIQYDKDTQNIIVSGIANSGLGKINDAQVNLENYLPCISNIDFSNVFDGKQIVQDITSETAKISSILKVVPNLNNGEIIISGYLTAKQLNELNELIIRFNNKYKNSVKFVSQVKDALSALPFKIYTIYTGDPAYLVTDDNRKVYVGGQISGFKLVSINQSKIVFSGLYNLEIPIDALMDNNNVTDNQNLTNSLEQKTNRKGNTSLQNHEVINEEFQTLQLAIESEQEQLKSINNYKKNIKDPNLSNFLSNQSEQLKKDIDDKQHELDYYTQ